MYFPDIGGDRTPSSAICGNFGISAGSKDFVRKIRHSSLLCALAHAWQKVRSVIQWLPLHTTRPFDHQGNPVPQPEGGRPYTKPLPHVPVRRDPRRVRARNQHHLSPAATSNSPIARYLSQSPYLADVSCVLSSEGTTACRGAFQGKCHPEQPSPDPLMTVSAGGLLWEIVAFSARPARA
jgi:hypothetical protein